MVRVERRTKLTKTSSKPSRWFLRIAAPMARQADPFRESRRGGKIPNMKVATGTVVDGKVVVEGETLAEGSTVTVVLRQDDEAFELTLEEEAELRESIAAIERGEFVSGERLLERLRRSIPNRMVVERAVV
jgi:hypothetical protein